MRSALWCTAITLSAALVSSLAGCGERTSPTSPDDVPSGTSTGAEGSTGADGSGPSVTATASASAVPPAASSGTTEVGQCKSDADCGPDEECALGVPLNGRCWKKGTPQPRCLARGTLIDTPSGAVPVETLREGDQVWTLHQGARVARSLSRVGRTKAPRDHVVRRIELADGRSFIASPSHPLCGPSTSEPTSVGAAVTGQPLDGSKISSVSERTYGEDQTYDLLPASDSGCYWAGGVLLGSTLGPSL